MAEEIGFENGRKSNFEGLVTLTLTLTLDPAIRHTVVHHSSTCTYIPNFIEIEETFCGRTDGHFPPLILLGRLLEVDLKSAHRRKHCVMAVVRRSQNFCPAADHLPGGAGWPKFNQLEMVTTFTYKPSLVKIDACNFKLSR